MCGVVGGLVGPVLVARVAGDALRVVVALRLFGMEWLRKGVLRLAGRRARSDSYAELVAEIEAPAAGRFDRGRRRRSSPRSPDRLIGGRTRAASSSSRCVRERSSRRSEFAADTV